MVVIERRVAAELDGPFVLFLIGVRINRPWKIWSWLPVFTAMPKMLAELQRRPELGLLHARTRFGIPNITMVQYWRSHAQLQAYAQARDKRICRRGVPSTNSAARTAMSASGTRRT